MLKSFTELNEIEKHECYRFIIEKKDSKQSFEDFIKYYGGEVFNNGNSCFVALNNENVEGIISIITKEVPIREEAFIFNFFVKDGADKSSIELLKKAVDVCIGAKSPIAKLGIAPHSSKQLSSIISGQGFQYGYEAFFMKLNKSDYSAARDSERLELVPLSDDNKNEYVLIHNNAFRSAPNGADTSIEELGEMLKDYTDKPQLIGLGKFNGFFAGIYELDIKEETGWINAVGIHENYLRKGLGEELIRKCIDILFSFGAREIKLTVIGSNERAVSLYKKLGFEKGDIISSWYVKELSI
jgi:ribosomal protein S18 acetylase RimI-like enzyme